MFRTMNNYNRKKGPFENRRLIIEAAIELIAEVDLEKWTHGALAKKANLSKGGVGHFPAKESVVEALFARTVDEFQSAIELAKEKGMPVTFAYLKAAIADNLEESEKNLPGFNAGTILQPTV